METAVVTTRSRRLDRGHGRERERAHAAQQTSLCNAVELQLRRHGILNPRSELPGLSSFHNFPCAEPFFWPHQYTQEEQVFRDPLEARQELSRAVVAIVPTHVFLFIAKYQPV